jgi:hypothetical protein
VSRWTKFALAATSALTLLVVALTTGGPAAALRAAGVDAATAAATAPIDALAGGMKPTGQAPGPIQMSIGSDWMRQGTRDLTGSLMVTCGPFMTGFGEFSTASISLSTATGSGFGSISPICDGAEHTYTVTVRFFGRSLQAGAGTARATAFASGLDPMTFRFIFQTGHAGPQQVSIT